MGNFCQLQLRKAIYDALTADASLNALVAGIHDSVPAETSFPYIVLGEIQGRDWSTKTTSGARLLITVDVYSRYLGQKEASDIMERIKTLIHQAPLVLTGYTLVMIRYDLSDIELENDGLTYHGRMRFLALVEDE